jgi:hypothetical protein
VRRAGRRTRAAFAAAVLAVAPLAAACSSSSEVSPLERDISDETVPGYLPTAPPPSSEEEGGLTPDANRLLAELDAVAQEQDLCSVLSGAVFEGLFTADIDPAGLVTNPAGITRLITAVIATFDHIVQISPPEIQPAMATVKEMWTRIASLNPSAGDLESQVNTVLAEPQHVAANRAIIAWGADNCAGPVLGGASIPEG